MELFLTIILLHTIIFTLICVAVFKVGCTKGYDEGSEKSQTESYAYGRRKGYEDGYDHGYYKGNEMGYNAGYADSQRNKAHR